MLTGVPLSFMRSIQVSTFKFSHIPSNKCDSLYPPICLPSLLELFVVIIVIILSKCSKDLGKGVSDPPFYELPVLIGRSEPCV